MRTSIALLPLSLALFVSATPLGDHATFRRHTGVPALGRRFILQSRMTSPPACAAKAVASNTTAAPDLSGTAVPPVNGTTVASTTAADNTTTIDPSTAANTTTIDPTTADNTTTIDPTTADNTTTIDPTTTLDNSTLPVDNSTTAANTTATRRFWSRIAQDDLPEVAQTWQDLCLQSGGDIFTDEPCVVLAGLNGINALLADADSCAQQDVADAMITFAKLPGVTNAKALIAQALAFRRHPRNAEDILGVTPSTMYCQRAPKNVELNGVVNAQLDGVNPGLFGSPNIPIVPFGSDGTCPFGTTPDVTTCSCINGSDTTGTVADTTSGNSTDTSTATDTSVATDLSATATDVSAAASATDSTAVTATDSATDAAATDAAATDAAATDATATDAAATDSAAIADATDSAASTDVATDAAVTLPPTAAATDAATAVAPATTAKTTGVNFQPSDISGDVNDPNGRRRRRRRWSIAK